MLRLGSRVKVMVRVEIDVYCFGVRFRVRLSIFG